MDVSRVWRQRQAAERIRARDIDEDGTIAREFARSMRRHGLPWRKNAVSAFAAERNRAGRAFRAGIAGGVDGGCVRRAIA